MNDLVGIIRKGDEMELALKKLEDFATRTKQVAVEGHREFNPGWHLALDLRNMRWCRCAWPRRRWSAPRAGAGNTRDDYPVMDSDWRHVLLVLSAKARAVCAWSARSSSRCGLTCWICSDHGRAEEVLHR